MDHKQQELTQVVRSLGFLVRTLAEQVKTLHDRNEEKDRLLADTRGNLQTR